MFDPNRIASKTVKRQSRSRKRLVTEKIYFKKKHPAAKLRKERSQQCLFCLGNHLLLSKSYEKNFGRTNFWSWRIDFLSDNEYDFEIGRNGTAGRNALRVKQPQFKNNTLCSSARVSVAGFTVAGINLSLDSKCRRTRSN